MSFRHIYHKIQGWKEYEYRTVTWLECPFVPACRIGYIRQGCWLLLILYLCYFYNLKSELPSAELSIWCRTEALNSKWNIKTERKASTEPQGKTGAAQFLWICLVQHLFALKMSQNKPLFQWLMYDLWEKRGKTWKNL